MRFIIWERSVQKKTDFWIVLCCILKEPKINMLEFSCWCKKIPNLSMKNYTQFHSFSLIKRVKYEMISPFSRNEKWKIFSLHSFREVKVKIKWLKIEIEKWKWKSNDSKSRSRSEFSKKFSRILENRDSRWSLLGRKNKTFSFYNCPFIIWTNYDYTVQRIMTILNKDGQDKRYEITLF